MMGLSTNSWAQVVSQTATGIVEYRGILNSGERREAIQDALSKALDTFVAMLSQPSLSAIYETNRTEIQGQKDRFILGYIQIDDIQDRDLKTYAVTVRANINQANLTNFIRDNFSVNQASISQPQNNEISFIFMSREVSTVEQFNDRVTTTNIGETNRSLLEETRLTAQSDQSISGGVAAIQDGSITQEASRARQETTTESGGGSLSRSSDTTYNVRSSLEFNTAITSILAASGYEVVEAEFVEGLTNGMLVLADIRNEFASGVDLQASTLLSVSQAFKQLDIPYFAIGALDTGQPDVDPVTGNVRVSVSITAKIYDFKGRFPITVSSVGPVAFYGLGSDQMVSTNNALAQAADNVGKIIAQELSLRNVQ